MQSRFGIFARRALLQHHLRRLEVGMLGILDFIPFTCASPAAVAIASAESFKAGGFKRRVLGRTGGVGAVVFAHGCSTYCSLPQVRHGTGGMASQQQGGG